MKNLSLTSFAFLIGVSVLIALASANVHAHEDHGKPQHGGIVAEGGHVQAELVASPTKLTIYLTDHGKAVNSKGWKAKLTILKDKTKTEALAVPTTESKLEVTGSFPIAKGVRVVGVVTSPDGKAASLRWAL